MKTPLTNDSCATTPAQGQTPSSKRISWITKREIENLVLKTLGNPTKATAQKVHKFAPVTDPVYNGL